MGRKTKAKGRAAGSGAARAAAAGREAALKEFDSHFHKAYGERWPELRSALAMPVEHVAWLNPFATPAASVAADSWRTYAHADSGCTLIARNEPTAPMPSPALVSSCAATEQLSSAQVASHYALDGASPLPAIALAPRPGHRVLDMCAAPGGKTLCLAGQMFHCFWKQTEEARSTDEPRQPAPAAARRLARGETLLFSNDCSGPRRARLRRVIDEYVPQLPPSAGAITVTGMDATSWGRGPGAPTWSQLGFDRILVDAPCSSERHFLHGAEDSMWSRARIKRDAELQGAIVRNAVRLLAVGGRLVYATCSLAEEENDGVVSKLLAHTQYGAGLALISPFVELEDSAFAPLLEGVTRTKCGALMLPDKSRFGPLYWAVIERRAAPGKAASIAGEAHSPASEGASRLADDARVLDTL